MPKVTISFDDNLKCTNDYVSVCLTNQNGIEIDSFRMTLDQAIFSIADNLIEEQPEMQIETSSPVLPNNCISYGQSISVNTGKRSERFLIEVPKQQWDIYVYSTFFMNVGFPRLLFSYDIPLNKNGKQIDRIGVYAVKDDGQPITEKTKLYKFPFSNVSNGILCLGTNSNPTISSYSELTDLHKRFFFNTPFTSDHYANGNRNLSGAKDIRELAINLTEKEFPEEWLLFKEMIIHDLLKNK